MQKSPSSTTNSKIILEANSCETQDMSKLALRHEGQENRNISSSVRWKGKLLYSSPQSFNSIQSGKWKAFENSRSDNIWYSGWNTIIHFFNKQFRSPFYSIVRYILIISLPDKLGSYWLLAAKHNVLLF